MTAWGAWDHTKGSQDPTAAFPPQEEVWLACPRASQQACPGPHATGTRQNSHSSACSWSPRLVPWVSASPTPAGGGSDHSSSPAGSSSLNYTLEFERYMVREGTEQASCTSPISLALRPHPSLKTLTGVFRCSQTILPALWAQRQKKYLQTLACGLGSSSGTWGGGNRTSLAASEPALCHPGWARMRESEKGLRSLPPGAPKGTELLGCLPLP